MAQGDENRGLYQKYSVYRVHCDDEGKITAITDPGPVFVLNYTKDPFARVALAAYADACAKQYPKLARDLRAALAKEE